MINYDSSDETFTSMIYTDNISPTNFRLHLDTWAGSRLYHSNVTWLRHSPHPLLQSGSIDANHAGGGYTSAVGHRINFQPHYAAPPKVFVALSGLKVGKGDFWDIMAYATGVDSRGFTLHISRTRQHEPLGNSQAHWLSFPEYGLPGLQICSGDIRLLGQTGVGHFVFEKPFEEEPMIFIAITQFRMSRKFNGRLYVKVKSVTEKGMDWTIEATSDTILERSAISFLAIERRKAEALD